MSTPDRDKIVEDLNQTIQRLGNRTVIFTHAIADHIGLSATEFECLDFLQDCGRVPAGRLAELTGLTSGAVTGLVDRLEKAGFVRRQPDPTDRRRVLVEAIDNAEASTKIRALYGPVATAFYKLTAKYSDAELQLVTKYMQESLAMIETVTDEMVKTKTDHRNK